MKFKMGSLEYSYHFTKDILTIEMISNNKIVISLDFPPFYYLSDNFFPFSCLELTYHLKRIIKMRAFL